jgi:hypothetical protein
MTIGTHSAGSMVGENEWYQNRDNSRLYQEMVAAQHYTTLSSMTVMSGYLKLPPYVPPGWADWYACGDQLH